MGYGDSMSGDAKGQAPSILRRLSSLQQLGFARAHVRAQHRAGFMRDAYAELTSLTRSAVNLQAKRWANGGLFARKGAQHGPQPIFLAVRTLEVRSRNAHLIGQSLLGTPIQFDRNGRSDRPRRFEAMALHLLALERAAARSDWIRVGSLMQPAAELRPPARRAVMKAPCLNRRRPGQGKRRTLTSGFRERPVIADLATPLLRDSH